MSDDPRPVSPSPDAPAPVALIAAVEAELEPLRAAVAEPREVVIGRRPALAGLLDGEPVILFAAGMGKTNAASGATALLERHPVRGVVNVGVAGAYPGSELPVGGVALAAAEVYGDEGVETPQGWISTEGIGIPLHRSARGICFNRFPLDEALVRRAAERLARAGIPTSTGPFVTVSCCSGTTARGAEIARRFGALAESMEGAAIAHVCALYDVPFLEVRGISNLVEDRDLSRWRLRDAIDAATRAARLLVGLFPAAPAPAYPSAPAPLPVRRV